MTVYLVGAGPGDPELLTRRAATLLARAEHVVYDRPSMASILALAPAAVRHCVGKHGSTPARPQDEINALLIALGRTGACVVRVVRRKAAAWPGRRMLARIAARWASKSSGRRPGYSEGR